MTKRHAGEIVESFIKRNLCSVTISEQIKIYEALSLIMPGEAERQLAQEIAATLSEAEKLQLDFGRQLFAGIWRAQCT